MGCAQSSIESVSDVSLKASWGVEKAVDSNDKSLLLKSLANGGSPNGLPDKGGTALHRAVHMKSVVITKTLLDNGADLTIMDVYKRTPLDVALIRNLTHPCESRIRIQKLLEAARDQLFVTDLQNALKNGKTGDVVLLTKGPTPLKLSDAAPAAPPPPPPEAPPTAPSLLERLNLRKQEGKKHSEERPPLELSDEEESEASTRGGAYACRDEYDDDEMCILCQDNPSQVAVLPCNHECLCLPCAVRTVPFVLQGVTCVQTCSICRGPMDALMITRTVSSETRRQEVAAAAADEQGWQPKVKKTFTGVHHASPESSQRGGSQGNLLAAR